jgi:hypothetical protein
MYAISVGSPFDGLVIYGPFDSGPEAIKWAENHLQGETWEMIELHDPNT